MQKGLCLLMMSLLLCSGCRIGPETKERVVIVRSTDEQGRPVKIGLVGKNVKVPVRYETEKGETGEAVLDIGGWGVVPPKANK